MFPVITDCVCLTVLVETGVTRPEQSVHTCRSCLLFPFPSLVPASGCPAANPRNIELCFGLAQLCYLLVCNKEILSISMLGAVSTSACVAWFFPVTGTKSSQRNSLISLFLHFIPDTMTVKKNPLLT